MADGGFWWTSESSGVFGEKLISLKDHALFFLASQIQKKYSTEQLLKCFIVVLMVQFFEPKLLKQHKTKLDQYPLAPTSIANRSTFQLLLSITLFRGMYLLILALCQASMFSSHGHVSSMRITLFSLLEKIVMSGLSSVNAMWGGKEKVPSRSPNKTQSDAWCNQASDLLISHWEKIVCFLLWFLFLQILF